jgi:hypothetical protein
MMAVADLDQFSGPPQQASRFKPRAALADNHRGKTPCRSLPLPCFAPLKASSLAL